MLSWDVFWDLTSNLIISGCDSTLTVLGMSAVISSLAHYLGLSILAFIGTAQDGAQQASKSALYTLQALCLCVCVCLGYLCKVYSCVYILDVFPLNVS